MMVDGKVNRGETWRHCHGKKFRIQDVINHTDTKDELVIFTPVGRTQPVFSQVLEKFLGHNQNGDPRYTKE